RAPPEAGEPAFRSFRDQVASENMLLEVALKAVTRLCRLGVEREVSIVDVVQTRRAERPGAPFCRGSRRNVDRRDHPRREELVLQHVAGLLLLVGDEGLLRR